MSATTAVEQKEKEQLKAPETEAKKPEEAAAEPAPAAAAAPAEAAAEEAIDEEEDQTNLIINYLPQRVTEAKLKEMFAEFGELVHVKLMLDRVSQTSMGYGFVKYAKPESAAAAIEKLNGYQMDQKTLRVGYSHPRTEANVYVGNLKPSVTKQQLEDLFRRFGPVIECKILVDHDSGVSKGCGFVKFENTNSAQDAINGYNSANLPDISLRPLTVKFARKHDKNHHAHFGGMQRQPVQRMRPVARTAPTEYTGFCLFIYNLPPDTTHDSLRGLFSRFGKITSANAILDYNGNCKGYGFVNFETKEEAEKAISEMNGYYYKNRPLKVSFKNEKRR